MKAVEKGKFWYYMTKLLLLLETVHFFSGPEIELNCHDGTIRDVLFMEEIANHSSMLVSAGAGDNSICITDCERGTLVRKLQGHSGMILQ